MVKQSTKFTISALAILGGIVLVFLLFYFKIFWLFDRQLSDKLFIKEKISDDIVIIEIDDISIKEYGEWPWNRARHAQMIEKLENLGVKAIGYDVTFSERGFGDEKLIEVLNNSQKVVFPMEGDLVLRKNNLPKFKDTLWPLDEIKHKFLIGHSSLVPEIDGKVRQMPFYVQFANEKVPPFFMQILDQAGLWNEVEGVNPYKYNFSEIGLFRIKFLGPSNTFTAYSFSDVLREDFKGEILKDKIVLVGSTAKNLHDEYFTSSTKTEAMSGVEIQANLIEGYLQYEFLQEVDDQFSYFFHLLMLGIFFGFCVFAVKLRYSFFIFIVGIVFYLILTSAIFSFGYILPILYPILLLCIIYFLGILVKYFLENKEKNKIKAGFSQYVDKEVVKQIIKNPEKLNLGGEKRKLSILFSDIRSFTSLSEKLSPEELVELLNEYLSAMGEAVIENNGVIDKFIGDAIMAFWGAPLDNQNQEVDSVRTSLYMIERLKSFNKKNERNNKPKLQIGIGINTGEVLVGNIGSKKRFDYTAIGDEVNLASRLEGLTKYYGVQIIISEKTKARLDSEFILRYLDTVAVKGKNDGVRVYEVMGVNLKNKKLSEFAYSFNRATQIYLKGKFKEAKFVFEKLNKKYPEDKVIKIYLERIKHYLNHPPKDFDGVFRADFK